VSDPRSAPGVDSRNGPRPWGIEGRRVPALYLLGWVGSVMGLAVLLVSFMASGSGAARWLFLAGLVVLGLGLIFSQRFLGSRSS